MGLESSIGAAITFLLSARDMHGWWRDFETLAGLSDEWVTAYVGTMLADVPDPRASRAAHQAWRLLKWRRWWSAGWGFNGWVPADADSTIWTLRLADSLRIKSTYRTRWASRFLIRHIRTDGGIATYAEDGPIRKFTRLQRQLSFQGWCETHTCVTAAGATLRQLASHRNIRTYLRRTQNQDGSWTGYWWCDREITSCLAAEALVMNPRPSDLDSVQQAVAWASQRIRPNGAVSSSTYPAGSAFATAWCLRLLILADSRHSNEEPAMRAVNWLLGHQWRDGSWRSSAAMRIPPPDVVNTENYQWWVPNGKGGGSIVFDSKATFTTATVLGALARFSKSSSERYIVNTL